MKHFQLLINSGKTVFKRDDIGLLVDIPSRSGLSNFLMRAKSQKLLQPMHNGLRALYRYDHKELACKIRKRAYISLETVLYEAGVIFQFSPTTIHCVSDDSRQYEIQGYRYIYHKIKSDILFNPLGIISTPYTMIATPERALCDLLYLYPQTTIENIEILDRSKLSDYIMIYPRSTALALTKLLNGSQS